MFTVLSSIGLDGKHIFANPSGRQRVNAN